jgi:GTP-binding protein LepA
VVVDVRVVDGMLLFTPNTSITFMASGAKSTPIELGYFMPQMKASTKLQTGEVGYIATGLKDVSLAKVGDTVTIGQVSDNRSQNNASELGTEGSKTITPLPGYKEPKPMVFLGLFPINSDEYPEVRVAIGKLRLSDSAFSYRPISSLALGNGFHCGFLGLLHAEVVQERLSREFNLSLFATAPSVEYLVKLKPGVKLDGIVRYSQEAAHQGYLYIQSAAEFPDPSLIEAIKEPLMQLSIFSPKRYVGDIMQLSQDKRAEFVDLEYIGTEGQTESNDHALAKFTYIIPLSEMIIDFFDQLKSVTQGYASLDYDFFDYAQVDVIKMDILVNHEKVDAFAQLVVSDRAPFLGRRMVEKLAEVIPRRQFNIPIQAAIGGQIIARADVKPFRKDVLQKLYGGDRTRKDKLLEKQKKGKTRMKMVGQIEIPQSAFLQVFRKS